MKSQELRIGNIVTQDGELINGITGNTLHKFEMGFISLNPIPLTDVWLVNFGFMPKTKRFTKNCISIKQQTKGCFFYHTGIMIEYVHQLQNLYFALTGEELTQKYSEPR